MFKRLKPLIYTRPFIAFAYYLIQAYSMTFRFQVSNEKKWKDLLKKDKPILLCGWHQQFFAAIHHFKRYAKYNPGLMISQSQDGDLIAGVANRTGWHTPRGSSSRGGKKALTAMIDHLQTYGFGAHILDGPKGPIGKVKPGVIKMAIETDAVVVPFYTQSENAWFFNSWDKFMLPKPFSKVMVAFGDEVCFAPGQTAENFESNRKLLETTMLPGLVL